MDITYFAIKPIVVGDEVRPPGALIPEANLWRRVELYVKRGDIMPVLVATLPSALRNQLKEWEQEQEIIMNQLIAEAEEMVSEEIQEVQEVTEGEIDHVDAV